MPKVLIVDDKPVNRQLLREILKYSHEILEAGDGAEALTLAHVQHPDLVITDILMPTMDGYELVHRLRADTSIPCCPVIFYTAVYHEREARSLAKASGVTQILIKPCEPEKILQVVNEVLEHPPTPVPRPADQEFESEHKRLLTDKLAQKVLQLENEVLERKRAEEELQRANDNLELRVKERTEDLRAALEAANSAKDTLSRLVHTIAHEFRTPLGLLTGCTDILDRYWDCLTPEKRREQNEHIRNAARQISNLVDSVTSFQLSGTDSHGRSLQVQDVGEICRSIATEVETVWGAGHEFIVSIAEDCGTALLDDILFRRILQNLLTNAFRYTPANGTVSLRVCREKSMLLLEIADSGIGIPKEEQALIFNAFYRSRNVEGRRGLGLGLSIVGDALSQMGGTITVTSSLGHGTTMRVEIPVLAP